MEEIIYSRPEEKDLPEIKNILDAVSGNSREMKAEDFLIAKSAGIIVGCGRLRKISTGSFELGSVAVLPEYRDRGIGGGIIERLLQGAEEKSVYLDCLKEKEGFYGRFGFKAADEDDLPAGFKEDFLSIKAWLADKGREAIAMKRAATEFSADGSAGGKSFDF